MSQPAVFAVCMMTLASCGQSAKIETASERPLVPIQSGYTFLTADTQALQDDPFANPGLLWVDRGETLFEASVEGGQSCLACHSNRLSGRAATFPKLDTATGKLINLEGQINQCRTERQDLPSLSYESDELLALTAYVAHQSLGQPTNVEITGDAAPAYQEGQAYFLTRRGQMNLSCQQCHTENWGKQLRGDTISQGHGNGFPAYRLEWQSVGSLHRRFRDCDMGVRAEPLPYGDDVYIALELYLASRSNGLPIESPAVRR